MGSNPSPAIAGPATTQVLDPLWLGLRKEAAAALAAEPGLGSLLYATVLARTSFEEAVAARVAERLGGPALAADTIRGLFASALTARPSIALAMRKDVRAVLERDPATERTLDPVLHFKGFHALQTHRLAHWLWSEGRRDLALLLQCRASEVFQVDIHPAARIGAGVFLDHATGFVAGETVTIEDGVSILQNVTLGGTGLARGDRHPKVRHGSLIGAGARILGPVEVGACSRVAAGAVVLEDVPPCTTVAGVPARIVGTGGCPEPARLMDQRLGEAAYAAFTYTI